MSFSTTIYTGNGSQRDFSFSFPYISRDHISVYIDNVPTTAFTFVLAGAIQLATAPASGAEVVIRRMTPLTAPQVTFADGSLLREPDLNLLAVSSLYMAQESRDLFTGDSPTPSGGGSLPISAAQVPFTYPGSGLTASVQVRLEDLTYADGYRLAGDTDDTLSIQRVLDLGKHCALRPGKTYVASGIIGRANTGLVCVGGRAIVQVPAGANKSGIMIDVDRFTLTGVNFNGGDTTSFKDFPNAARGTRCGVIVGATAGTNRNLHDVSISDCDVFGFDNAGIWGRVVMEGNTIFGKKVSIHNVSAYTCYNGIWYDERFEYVSTTNSHATECRSGFYVQGGNNSFTGCHSTWCWDNFFLEFGYNDGHGQAVGCSFNHAYGGHNIFAKNVGNGFTFSGCSMWFGNVEILGSYGISITNSVLANLVINISGGGVNNIDNNYFVVAVSTVFTGFCFTTFRRNRDTYQATTINQEVNYGDLWMVGKTSTAIGVLQTNTTAAEFPIAYGTKKFMGKTLNELQTGNRAVIQKTGLVRSYFSVVFTTGAAIQTVKMKIRKYDRTATNILEELDCAAYCPASTVGLSIQRAVEWEFEYGEQIQILLSTSTATGFTPTAVDVRHSLVY